MPHLPTRNVLIVSVRIVHVRVAILVNVRVHHVVEVVMALGFRSSFTVIYPHEVHQTDRLCQLKLMLPRQIVRHKKVLYVLASWLSPQYQDLIPASISNEAPLTRVKVLWNPTSGSIVA